MNSAEDQTKLKLALMGEFSAGKSTLANLLLEQQASPTQVTATQLPPVWYSQGLPAAERIGHDGTRAPLNPEDLACADLESTRQINVMHDAPFLGACDLIDMPGTSDPNMAPDYWERILPEVDAVIWCTPANQAWRQSEAALWELVPPKLWKNSLLLITRADKLRTDRDRARLTMRVRREVDGLFRDVLPVSLTRAIAASDDPAALEASGAPALLARIGDTLESLGKHPLPRLQPVRQTAPEPRNPEEPQTPRIVPRRVVATTQTRGRNRPAAPAH